jgi:L-rhamnose mutarotase
MWGNKTKEVETKSSIEKLNEYKHKRTQYYSEMIKSMSDGAVSQFTSVFILEKIKQHYGYYSLDGSIVYYDDDTHRELLKYDIATYPDSSGNIVVTVDQDRLRQFKIPK